MPDYIASACVYSGIAKKLVKCLKYKDKTQVVSLMAQMMMPLVENLDGVDIIICVPDFRKNFSYSSVISSIFKIMVGKATVQNKRLFNQSLLLGYALKKVGLVNAKIIPDFCIKNKRTTAQASIRNRRNRLENLKDAFVFNKKHSLKPRAKVLIVDDVITTGATINELAKAILVENPST